MALRIIEIQDWTIRIRRFRSSEKTWVDTIYFDSKMMIAGITSKRENRLKDLQVDQMLDIQGKIGLALGNNTISHSEASDLINVLDQELLKRLP